MRLGQWLEEALVTHVTQPLLNYRLPPVSWERLGAVVGHALGPAGELTVSCQGGTLLLEGITPRVWRVVAQEAEGPPSASESVVSTSRCALRAGAGPGGALSVATAAGGELTATVDPRRSTVAFDFAGRRLHGERSSAGFRRGWISCQKRSPEPELYLGFGEKTGPLFKNGAHLVMWNTDNPEINPRSDPIYQSCPLQIALRRDGSAHALYFDNPHYCVFAAGGRGPAPRSLYVAAGGPLCYYVLAGPTLAEVLQQFAELTGRAALPPRWVLGYHHSRWDPQESAGKVLDTARELRRRGIPCDVIHLDIGHMDGHRCFTWDPARFPDPPGLIRELHALGFKVITIVDPGLKRDPAYPAYAEGLRQGHFCTLENGQVYHDPVWPGPAAFPDFTSPEVRAWWGRLFAGNVELGVDGVWLDMNEPSTFTLRRTAPPAVRHCGSGSAADIPHARVHNLYGLLMARATREGLRALAPQRRPFVFTRAAHGGIQRYAGSWTGDNRSSWSHLRMSIPMLLNLGLSGQPVVGADVGGFAGRPSPELMARWLQLATFYPFCRNHTAQHTPSQDVWRFGPEVEEIGRSCLELRYSLLPYLYTLAWQAGASGLPLMRPLFLEFPQDPACRTEEVAASQFLAGSVLLAAPVLHPGRRNREVYLPEAEYWEDWWTGERFEGRQRIAAAAPLQRLPLYVRAGSALPMTGPARSVEEAASLPLSWRVYPATEIAGRLYLDDGVSTDHEHGLYSLLELRGGRGPEGGTLRLERIAGSLEPPLGRHPGLTLEVRGGREERFSVDARRLSGRWSLAPR